MGSKEKEIINITRFLKLNAMTLLGKMTTPQFKSLYKKLERNNAEYQSH